MIVVVDRNWAIGKENKLLVHLPGDLRYFKQKTLGKVIVMGRKTLESLPGGKPLQGRDTIVLTRDKEYVPKAGSPVDGGLFTCHSMENLSCLLDDLCVSKNIHPEDIFIAGGSSIYEQFLPYCNCFFVTKIDEVFIADSYFTNLDKLTEDGQLGLTWESEYCEEKEIRYRFIKYERRKKL